MKRPIVLAVLAFALSPVAALAGPASDAVKAFYAPVGFEADPAVRDRFVDPARAIFEQHDKTANSGEVGCIDFGLSVDAQDYDDGEIGKTLDLTEKVTGDDATVTAKFNLFPDAPDSKREIVWTLKNVGGAWKVADIASPANNWRLSEFDCK